MPNVDPSVQADALGVKKTVVVGLIALVMATPSHALIDVVVDWQALQVQAVVDSEVVAVTARLEKDAIAELAVRVRGRISTVPKAELAGVPGVVLNTLRVISPDVKSHKGPNVRIEFDLIPLQATTQRGVVALHFDAGTYAGRLVERVVDGKLVIREWKEPGKPVVPVR